MAKSTPENQHMNLIWLYIVLGADLLQVHCGLRILKWIIITGSIGLRVDSYIYVLYMCIKAWYLVSHRRIVLHVVHK